MILRQFAGSPRGVGLIIFAAGIAILLTRLVYDLVFEMTQARKEYRILSQSSLISGPDIPQKGRALAGAIEKNRRNMPRALEDLRPGPPADPGNSEPDIASEAGISRPEMTIPGAKSISAGRFATVPLEDPEDPEDPLLAAPCDAYRTVSLEK